MNKLPTDIPKVEIKNHWTPPKWALLQRHMINILNDAALEFVERYVAEDGTLIWRDHWPGMDGSDDPYEGFMNLALFYTLGGSEEVYQKSREIWEGITWQWTEYGQIHNEFDAYYDWMHHGEGSLFFYFLGLAKPNMLKDRQRAMKFANFYTGRDPDVQNYDPDQKLIRSPLTGSKGPRFTVTAEDWSTHRGVLDEYLAPYEDISGVDFSSMKCPWTNDTVYHEIIEKMNQKMNKGDVPLNLNATSLVTHAFMYSQDDHYKQWVLDYLQEWVDRTERNGGIMPDNIGLSGKIGEYNDGKWWGGYYGWRWPHGFMTLIEPVTNACMNATLLTGKRSNLTLARKLLDKNWELGRKENGKWVVPHRYFDSGWTDYRLPDPKYSVYLWTSSMQEEDLKRIDRIDRDHDWNEVIVTNISGRDKKTGRDTKHFIGNTLPWFQYIRGEFPNYPEQILEANLELIARQLEKMRSEAGDPNNWDNLSQASKDMISINMDIDEIHAWQEFCPVYFEGLLQLTLGGPMHISHGGLQFGRVRYFDVQNKRPGLPNSVSALVENITDETAVVNVVNINQFESREVIIQAGTFGEHEFTSVDICDQDNQVQKHTPIHHKWFQLKLEPGSGAKLRFHMKRFVHQPIYQNPWSNEKKVQSYIQGRNEN